MPARTRGMTGRSTQIGHAVDLDIHALAVWCATNAGAGDLFAGHDLAGARISAEGAVRDVGSAPDGSLQGRISAERLDGLADLVSIGTLAAFTAAFLTFGVARFRFER